MSVRGVVMMMRVCLYNLLLSCFSSRLTMIVKSRTAVVEKHGRFNLLQAVKLIEETVKEEGRM